MVFNGFPLISGLPGPPGQPVLYFTDPTLGGGDREPTTHHQKPPEKAKATPRTGESETGESPEKAGEC